jgi:undecaprenyl-diphosphatase
VTPDDQIILWLHMSLPLGFSDNLFLWFSSRSAFSLPILGLLLITAVREHGWRGVGWWSSLILLIGLGDQFGGLLKTLFHELRPCVVMTDTLLHAEPCTGNTKGMPSNHALTFYSASMFVIFTRPHWRRWHLLLLISAFLVSVSRIYLAKHYPSQVIGGAFLGILTGLSGAFFFHAKSYLYPFFHKFYRFIHLKPWGVAHALPSPESSGLATYETRL